MARMLLIDGSNHAFRVQFALPPRHASDGFPTRVLYGFLLLFQKMLRTYKPDYVAVSFDTGRNFREGLYSAYKGHRPEMPEDLRQQWPYLTTLVEAFGYKVAMAEGYEADDVLGTLAKRFAGPDVEVFLVTADKDFCQLVNDHVRILDEQKGETLDRDAVLAKWGVPPEHIVDMLALMGDASDNVPGVTKIGEKTAAKLVHEHGDLDGVLAAAKDGRIKGKTGENLVNEEPMARLSKQLVTIATDAPLSYALDDLKPGPLDVDTLRALFDRWEFGAAARKLLPEAPAAEGATGGGGERLDVAATLAAARAGRLPAFDLTWSDDTPSALPLGVAFASSDGTGGYVPWAQHAEALATILADAKVPKVGFRLARTLRALGPDAVQGVTGDVYLLDVALAAHRRTHDLPDMAARHLGRTLGAVSGGDVEATLAVERAQVIAQLAERLAPKLEDGPRWVYDHVERPLTPVLARMERAGIRLDVQALGKVDAELTKRIAEVEAQAHAAAGRTFSLRSRNELQAVLFDELKLPAGKKLKEGFSTAADVLEKLAELHPLPALVLAYRELDKLRGTYVVKLPDYVGSDGRIHTTYNQAGAATGRLSSNDPNLQNIPVRTAEGRRVRECFVADPGSVFVSADYSQIELRILAHFTEDAVLIEGFRRGEDIHRRTAVEIFGADPDQVTIAQRSAAKAINFGLLYGMSAFRLGNDLQIPREQAQAWMDAYFDRMPKVRAWIDATKARCKADGYVETLYGRRRMIPEIHSSQFVERSAAEREAVNTVIQGTAADVVKLAMLRVDRALARSGLRARMLLQVHDELLIEAPEGEAEDVRSLLVEEMRSAAALAVPLEVAVSTGRTWNEAHG